METIVAENIARNYDNKRGIHGISISVRSGQCLGVLGANGSGKTTLTRLVAGLEPTQCGSLYVLGGPAYPRPKSLRHRCGVALDTPAHWQSLSARQNLLFFARQYGLNGSSLTRRVDELLFEADLDAQADEPVADYSFGMSRKLSIIEALCHDPDLLILDDPSAGIDTAFKKQLIQWIRKRCQDGKTTWVADNNADWVSKAATNAILLCDGRIKAQGDVPELMAAVEQRNRIEILLEQNGFDCTPNIQGIDNFRCDGNHVSAEMNGNPKLTVELLDWVISNGGRVCSMEVFSVTLYEALKQQAKSMEGYDAR